MRYGTKIQEIDVLWVSVDWQSSSLIEQIEERFHDPTRRTVHLRVARSGDGIRECARDRYRRSAKERTRPGAGHGRLALHPADDTESLFRRMAPRVPVYSFDALEHGHVVNGPAIVESETTTVVINSGDRIAVNNLGWLDIQVR